MIVFDNAITILRSTIALNLFCRKKEKNEVLITAIYGYHDLCCIYLFTKVSFENAIVYWNDIGINNNFAFEKLK